MSRAVMPAGRTRSWALLGNTAVLAALLLAAAALLTLQTGPWWLASPLPARWGLALAALLVYAAFCTVFLRRTCKAPAPMASGDDGAAPMLVVWASQTGFAQALAERSAAMLRAAGTPTRVLALDQVDAALLESSRQALFIASTTGEGDPPDHALRFLRTTMGTGAAALRLDTLRYALLALGDRSYADFCGFGRQLDAWLRGQGAQPVFDPVEVDNADAAALRHWQYELGRIGGIAHLPDWAPPVYGRWRLERRVEANPGSAGGPAFEIALAPSDASERPAWQAGDIAEIGPRNSPERVARLLATLALQPDLPVVVAGHRERLDAVLARCHLPDDVSVLPRAPQMLADTLRPMPHREYSIASVPEDGELRLLVRLMHSADGGVGLGSGWLCRHAVPGTLVDLRIRSNPGFHPPSPERPLILIGNGTGMAGLRAHLRARIALGATRTWLLFGERNADRDFFFGREITGWETEGWLERLDLAFSRDQDARAYVQDRLLQAADTLRDWVADGAAILVCGNATGMAPAVDAALARILGEDLRDQLREQGRYRRDVY